MAEPRSGPRSRSTARRDATDDEQRAALARWVNMARACEVLGVNESTVRRWADAGQIRCFRTPGGHRRFSERELLDLVEGRSGGRRELEEAAVSRIRRELSSGRGEAAWYERMASDERETLRPLGRRLAELVDDDIARRSPRAEIEREVDAIGERYGQLLFERGMPLSQAIEAFTFFRRSLDEAAKRLSERRRMGAAEAARAREQIAGLADRVLRGVSAAYDDPAGAGLSGSIVLDLDGRRVLLVGEGRDSARQVEALAGSGALVTILAPEIGEALRRQVGEGRAQWTPRRFVPGDTAGFDMVLIGASAATEAEAEARERGISISPGRLATGAAAGPREERGA